MSVSCRVTAAQLKLATEVEAYLSENIQHHLTTEQLAEHFDVSATHIKKCFSAVYGIPVQHYARKQKMNAAAELLILTNRTVLDIAGQFGYSNGSKFASAFRRVKGVSPKEYREKYQTEKE